MSTEIILILVVAASIAGVFIFLFLARRALRLAVRLVLALILMLIVGSAALWWSWYGSGASSPTDNRPSNTRRGGNSR